MYPTASATGGLTDGGRCGLRGKPVRTRGSLDARGLGDRKRRRSNQAARKGSHPTGYENQPRPGGARRRPRSGTLQTTAPPFWTSAESNRDPALGSLCAHSPRFGCSPDYRTHCLSPAFNRKRLVPITYRLQKRHDELACALESEVSVWGRNETQPRII